MQHIDGRRRGRRRVPVAALTVAMTLAALVAVSAPASSAGRAASGRAQLSRARGNFDVRTQGGAAVAPSATTSAGCTIWRSRSFHQRQRSIS